MFLWIIQSHRLQDYPASPSHNVFLADTLAVLFSVLRLPQVSDSLGLGLNPTSNKNLPCFCILDNRPSQMWKLTNLKLDFRDNSKLLESRTSADHKGMVFE
jgi:hypothetical protein